MTEHEQEQEPEVFELLRKIRYDATAIQAKVTDALKMLAEMNLPKPASGFVCPRCGADRGGPVRLEDHLANVHGLVRAAAAEVAAGVAGPIKETP